MKKKGTIEGKWRNHKKRKKQMNKIRKSNMSERRLMSWSIFFIFLFSFLIGKMNEGEIERGIMKRFEIEWTEHYNLE